MVSLLWNIVSQQSESFVSLMAFRKANFKLVVTTVKLSVNRVANVFLLIMLALALYNIIHCTYYSPLVQLSMY